ncbi:adhesion G protein-coupled receptor L3-like isoform X2 [Rhopilema esculentum]|uniref:adhesion G protein-coupled receptor L3-like isoform X2 n=1 Tax=Rhopilema esculentum TaxID=499914 RepID=UPI0031DAC64D
MIFVLLCFAFLDGSVATNSSINVTAPPTVPTTAPPTLSPLQLQKLWCRQNYSDWRAPVVSGCNDPFTTPCANNFLNATNGYYACKAILSERPTAADIPGMLLPGLMFDLGTQLAGYYHYKRTITAEEDLYRLKRFDGTKMLFEAGVGYKYSDRVWPNYNQQDRFPKRKWNGRNDTILLPYATIPSGVFQYSFMMYDNTQDEKITKDDVRLKKTWRSGHLVATGAFVDYAVEDDLIYSPKYIINSAVVSLGVIPIPKAPVASDIIITLWHRKKGMFQPWCVYWQYLSTNAESTKYQNGYWTNYGMRVVKTNDTTTICAASQVTLSSFAVVMEPYYDPPPEPTDPFTLATIILTIVSILILLAYVIAMYMLGCTRTKYSRMYIYMAVGCLMSQLVFLFGLSKKEDWGMCTTLSVIMQLFHTTVMSWSMLESVHQLSRIRYFFNEDKSNIEAFYSVIGWGFPLAVIISLIGYPFENFTKVRYCWVYVRGFDMWFFAGPLAALFIISLVLRLITFYEIWKHPERKVRDINYQRAWRSLVASAFFLPLIAILWYVATVGVTKSDLDAGPYLMMIPAFNAAVGITVFIFYFYKNDEVHDALVEQRKIKERKRLLRYEHLKNDTLMIWLLVLSPPNKMAAADVLVLFGNNTKLDDLLAAGHLCN